MTERTIAIGNRRLRVSNPDKVLYPETGFTKGDVIDYYRAVSGVMLPHLRGRPVTLKRYPDGVEGEHFFEKSCPEHRPPWLHTVTVRRKRDDTDMHYCLLDNVSSLVWAANLAALELHVGMAAAPALERPRALVFDLDPGPGCDVLDCADVALRLRDRLADLGLEAVAKTSGSKGLHLFVPLNTRGATFDASKELAHRLASSLESEDPDRVTATMSRSERAGKVFIDWSQNTEHKTTVCAYSLRARRRPTVSTPVSWDEVEGARRAGDPERLSFTAADVLRRVDGHGDLFAAAARKRQRLPG